MAFKINPPYDLDWTPIYTTKIEDGALGKGNKNGTILVSDELHPKDEQSIIDHEKVHIDQMKRGDLDYDDEAVYWKGKKYCLSFKLVPLLIKMEMRILEAGIRKRKVIFINLK